MGFSGFCFQTRWERLFGRSTFPPAVSVRSRVGFQAEGPAVLYVSTCSALGLKRLSRGVVGYVAQSVRNRQNV